MIYRLTIPGTIEDTDAVRVLEWHALAGDSIAAGQLLVELETHKALIEVRAMRAAVLRELTFEEGAWCKLGATLALLSDGPDEPLSRDAPAAEWLADFQIG
jgi:pyruvate/2-oxoglutarate dehydrogenase complex dihydrolipoamide acyltransferase (E2) component